VASGPLASVAVSQLDELTHRAVLSWLDYRRTRWLVGSSVVEDRQIELAEAVGSVTTSISTVFPGVTVKPKQAAVHAAPRRFPRLRSRAQVVRTGSRTEKVRACLATAAAPRTTIGSPAAPLATAAH
jgi:hypothetical protein